jgi:hypothetical protein
MANRVTCFGVLDLQEYRQGTRSIDAVLAWFPPARLHP